MVQLFFYTRFLEITNSKILQTALAVTASQQYLFIHLCLLILINTAVNESFTPVVGQDPQSTFPTQGFIAGHDNIFCGKPFGQHRSSPKPTAYSQQGQKAGEAQRAKTSTKSVQPQPKTSSIYGLLLKGITSTPGRPSTKREGWLDSHRCVCSSLCEDDFEHWAVRP